MEAAAPSALQLPPLPPQLLAEQQSCQAYRLLPATPAAVPHSRPAACSRSLLPPAANCSLHISRPPTRAVPTMARSALLPCQPVKQQTVLPSSPAHIASRQLVKEQTHLSGSGLGHHAHAAGSHARSGGLGSEALQHWSGERLIGWVQGGLAPLAAAASAAPVQLR